MKQFFLYLSLATSTIAPISLFIYSRLKEKEEAISKNESFKKTTNSSSIDPKSISKLADEDVIIIEIGGVTSIQQVKNFKETGVNAPVIMDNTELIKIKLDSSNGILVNSKIYDYYGKLTAQIIDNKWSINPNNIFKREFDSNKLQVEDNFGNIVLTVNFLSSNTIRINGIFVTSEHVLFATDEGIIFMPTILSPLKLQLEKISGKKWEDIYNENAKKIKPLF